MSSEVEKDSAVGRVLVDSRWVGVWYLGCGWHSTKIGYCLGSLALTYSMLTEWDSHNIDGLLSVVGMVRLRVVLISGWCAILRVCSGKWLSVRMVVGVRLSLLIV